MTLGRRAFIHGSSGLVLGGLAGASQVRASGGSDTEIVAPTLMPPDALAPATTRTTRALVLLERVWTTMQEGEYRHGTRIDRRAGVYRWDCSGMTNWVLAHVSKPALAALDRERPVAATYERVIRKAHPDRVRGGWRNVLSLEEVRAGDIFSWKRPPSWPRKNSNTGHVGFVVDHPRRWSDFGGLQMEVGDDDVVPTRAYSIRVADSTRWAHEDDTRAEGGTGLGLGTLLFLTGDDGRPTHYAWHGRRSRHAVATRIAFGRY